MYGSYKVARGKVTQKAQKKSSFLKSLQEVSTPIIIIVELEADFDMEIDRAFIHRLILAIEAAR